MSRHTVRADVSWFAARWKAWAALAGSLATGLIVVWPSSHILQVIIALVGALVTTGAVHQVPNAGVAPVQKTVDAVTSLIPDPAVAVHVAQAVTDTTTGVLAGAVGTLGSTVEQAAGSLIDGVFDDSPPAGS